MVQLADLARGLGCCYLAFQPLIYNGSLLENNDFKSEFMVEGRDIRRLEDSFRKLGSIRKDLLSRGFHIDFMAEKTVQHFKKERKVNTCFAGFSRIFVNPQGDISFVCFESIGNIKVDRLSDVWYGQKANAIRKKIRECKVNCTQFVRKGLIPRIWRKIHSDFKNTINSRFHEQICISMLKAEDMFLDSLRADAGNDDYIMKEVSRIRRDIAGMIQTTAVREG
jgi:MoaA/NifB/PqqE/SkfB family radical SAM enzyme